MDEIKNEKKTKVKSKSMFMRWLSGEDIHKVKSKDDSKKKETVSKKEATSEKKPKVKTKSKFMRWLNGEDTHEAAAKDASKTKEATNKKETKPKTKSAFIRWLNGEDLHAGKNEDYKKLVAEANAKPVKQLYFKTLQNPYFGVEYFKQLYPNKEKCPTLYVNGLTKFYSGNKAPSINNISFVVEPGQFHAFIGGNGAGKTTVIKSIVGAYSSWNGTIMINGIPNTNPASKNFLGYFPEKALFPEATSTFNYLLSMAKLDGMNYHDAVAAVERVLKQVGIKELEKRCPNSFSSGQKKKVLLAQALLTNPSILIMDEPTAMLDPAARQDLFKHIAELRKLGKSILISSHVLTELEKYADSVTIIEKGNLIYTGNIHDINEKITKNLYVVDVDKYDVVKKYCNQKKLYDTTIKDKYCVQLSTEAQKQALFNFIEDSHLILEKFYPYVPSLEDVYDKLTTIAKKKIAKGVKK